jgi:YVTN family beta-propeller protein
VTVGNAPNSVAISPDNKWVYVSNRDDDTVSVINTSSNTVEATVSVGSSPHLVLVKPQ